MKRTGLSQSNVSNLLGCLRERGLVTREQQGRLVFYQLSDPHTETTFSLIDDVLTNVACGVQDCTRYILPEEPTL